MAKARFTSETARESGKKSGASRRAKPALTRKEIERSAISLYIREALDENGKDGTPLARQMGRIVIKRASEDVRWYELMLKMIGEHPGDKVEISRPKAEMAEDIAAALNARLSELKGQNGQMNAK